MDIIGEGNFNMLDVIEPPIYGVPITNNQALDLALNNHLEETGILQPTPGTIASTKQILPPPFPKN